MKSYALIMLLVVGICGVGQPGWATEGYVSDSFEITFRTGPGVDRKIIATLRSGDRVEVLEAGETWSHIRPFRDGISDTKGWVLSRYLVERQPWEVQAKSLLRENGQLKMRLETAQNELAQVTEQEKSLRRRQAESEESLQKMRRDYEPLKEESSDFLKLKKEYSAAKASLEDVAGRLRELT